MFNFFDYTDYYYIILALQAFCLFHAYRNHNDQKWYWLIVFLPLIGSLIYLYENFYNRKNVRNVKEGFKGLIYSNYALEKLEKAVKFSESYTNKINLGDAYTERGRYEEAIKLYESCRNGIFNNNLELTQKLSNAYFLNKEYNKVIELSKEIEPLGEAKIAYAWALHYTGDTEKAESIFKQMDRRFSNYAARLEYASFMIESGQSNKASNYLDNIIEEFDSIHTYEKKLKSIVLKEAKRLKKSINK
ncbi:tetratricopeptide repeat protein [Emticicia aquatilis]|uniref:tetratricopeptide repeat protein n=1 Tax=Emticicia aquatilis TaxID=1537369 RepID=UPI0016647093|nr:tetratricopeptide repeat protein [Emticicia aquatilis]